MNTLVVGGAVVVVCLLFALALHLKGDVKARLNHSA